MHSVDIRPLRAEDGAIAAAIFFDAVHQGTVEHYTLEERIAWAGARPDPSGGTSRLRGLEGFVAEIAGVPAGFMTIDAAGYVDLAYVRPEMAGKGVGWRLYEAVENRARQLGAVRLTT